MIHPDCDWDGYARDDFYIYHAEDSIPEAAVLLYDANGRIISTKKPKEKIGYATAR